MVQVIIRDDHSEGDIEQIRGNGDIHLHVERMTLLEFHQGSEGVTLNYAIHESRFGKFLLAVTGQKQVACIDFIEDEEQSLEKLRQDWTFSTLIRSPELLAGMADRIFHPASSESFHLLARGTPFQLKVWKCLIDIPFGKTVSYRWVAEKVGIPKGAQAVGNAIGKNPIAFLIPCHRVVTRAGQVSGYRWGIRRKAAILDWEHSLSGPQGRLF